MRTYLVFLLALLTIGTTFAQTKWSQVADYNGDARHHPICFAIDSFGYIVSGSNNADVAFPDVNRYNGNTGTWDELTDFPGGPRGFGVGLAYDGSGYLGFGLDNGFPQILYDDLWRFDPATETWTELAPLPDRPGAAGSGGRFHPAFVALNGKIYVGLGGGRFGNDSDWWEYDIATNVWTQKADFPGLQRHHPYYFAIGDHAYVGLGHGDNVGGQFNIFNDFYRYDPATDTWTAIASLPSQGRVAGTQFDYEGKGYVLAGQDENHAHFEGELWEYDPDLDTWTQLESFPLPGGRWAPGSFVIDSSLYFNSGEGSNNQVNNDVWKYQLPAPVVPVDTTQDTTMVSVNGIAQLEIIKLYPNPVQNQLIVEQLSQTPVSVSLLDLSGRTMTTTVAEGVSTIDMANLPSGMYIVAIGENRYKVIKE